MILFHPFWLILLLPLTASRLKWRLSSKFSDILRVTAILLLVLALCDPALKLPSGSGIVVVVADRSRSMPEENLVSHKEAVRLVRSGMKENDLLAVTAFGRNTVVESPPGKGEFPGFANDVEDDQSNLAQALQRALSLIPNESPGRILVLSDGKWTGADPMKTGAYAARRSVAVDFRMYRRHRANDISIDALITPETTSPGESFILKARVNSPTEQEIEYTLFRGNTVISKGVKEFSPGKQTLLFRDKATYPGTYQYSLHIKGREKDPVPENNQARTIMGVRGPHPILFVSDSKNSGLARLLLKSNINIKKVPVEDCRWSLEELSHFSGLIIENVSADKIGLTGMENISAWVQETGAGIMMTGGKNSYGPGGYFRSPLASVMPVSMELRYEHRKLALAIAVVLDRSGSMAADAGGQRKKMDLANLGAVEVLDLLSPIDEFGVIAVDSSPHLIVDIGPVKEAESKRRNILAIESGGGGIFVYEGLVAAARMLQDATSETRHIILFADAADAEEPGNYKELLEKCAKANITVSVIGLGRPVDRDAELLLDIAVRGNGRCFFTDNPWAIPSLFAQDTFTVARSAFIDEPVPVKITAAFSGITDHVLKDIPDIGGYNLCYIKPGANLAMITQDDYKAPVVAFWHAGKGRALSYTAEADGEFTGPIADWSQAGDFITSIVRWTCGLKNRLPEDMLVTQEMNKGILKIELELDPERREKRITSLPKVGILRGILGKKPLSEPYTMQWSSPDTLMARIPVMGRETVLPTLDIPGIAPVTLTPSCLPYSPEFTPSQQDSGLAALQELARTTNGKERINLAGIWEDLPEKPQYRRIACWLIISAVVLFLFEIFHRRTGLPALKKREKITKHRKPERKIPREGPVKKKADISHMEKYPVSDAESEDKGALDAMSRAKKEAEKRMKR